MSFPSVGVVNVWTAAIKTYPYLIPLTLQKNEVSMNESRGYVCSQTDTQGAIKQI